MNMKVPKEEVWTTKEGIDFRVRDMNESHVRNTLRMIIRDYKALGFENYDDLLSWVNEKV